MAAIKTADIIHGCFHYNQRSKTMRVSKLVATLLAVLALGAVAAATASAAQPEFLETGGGSRAFTGVSKKAKLQVKGGATIECTNSKANGELTSNTTAKFTVTFEGCKSLGLAANSLSDAAGIIKVKVTASTCFINLSPLEAGLIITPTAAHIEVPAATQLVVVSGSFVAKVEPINAKSVTDKLVIAQKGGVQTIDGCRNAANELEKLTLLTLENEEGEAKQSGEEAVEGTITFIEAGHEEELMA